MALDSDHKYDVFISYAHADNQPFSGTVDKPGWVTIFADSLGNFLSRMLNRDASVWIDHSELTGNAPLTPAIIDALRQSATIVVVMSPRYLASKWCDRERDSFLQFVKQCTDAKSRVFRVDIDAIGEIPEELGDRIGYTFWAKNLDDPTPRTLGFPVPDPSDQEYYRQLNRLARELSKELKCVNQGSIKKDSNTSESDASESIFLAEVTDDLDSKREEVKDYLTQAGFRILPDSWHSYEQLETYLDSIDGDLARCQLFAQLLSEVVGKRPFNQSSTYAQLQYQRALATGKRILQWRSDKIKTEGVSDLDHRALLDGPSVRAESIEEYKRALVVSAKPPKPPPPRPANKFVYVSADLPDRCRAEELIGRRLNERGIGYSMVPQQGNPEAVRQFIEASLANCDAALVIYCATDQGSVLSQVLQCRKIIAQRDQPIPAIAIYDGPPPPEQRSEISFQFPNVEFLNCRHDQTALEKFLDGLI
ncbi:MAG TPA: hypothetical protein DC054_11580 [Blastocatellia bacterium]|nr:hypothetical protein [Blastocatellia bacterium]